MMGEIIWDKEVVKAMVPIGYSVIKEEIIEGGWTSRVIGKDGRYYRQTLSVSSGGWNWITEHPNDINQYTEK